MNFRKLTIILWLIAPALSFGQIQPIKVGGSPNNEDGDLARDAWAKQNANNALLAGGAYAISNNISLRDRRDLEMVFNALAPVSSNFVDGILFQSRFGTNTSLKLNAVSGYRGNFTADRWGMNMTNGLSLALPNALSNLTVVAMVREPRFSGKAVLWSLANTNTQSSIAAANSGAGIWQVQETFRNVEWPGANNGSFSNLFTPLWLLAYQYDEMIAQAGEPMVIAWQRDAGGNWRTYLDTTLGKISLNNGNFVFPSPTNATDPLTLFQLGYDVTNSPGWSASSGTNMDLASVFIFNTTNFSAVVAGYQAALCANDSDSAEFFYGDSRQAPEGNSSPNYVQSPSQFYARRLSPSLYFRNFSQGGTRADVFISNFVANGGLSAITNLPRNKIKNIVTDVALGINDIYQGNVSSATLFGSFTNIFSSVYNAGSQIRFLDVFQIATNSSALTYTLQQETNAFVANQMVRTNNNLMPVEYIPLRDAITQTILQTNGIFSADGVHLNGRTNQLANQLIGDLIGSPKAAVITNTAIGPQ